MQRFSRAVFLPVIALSISTEALAQGPRLPGVAIVEIDDIAQSGKAAALTAMIQSSIAATNKFRVIEREQLAKLERKQTLEKRGTITSRDNGRIGGFEGADYLIYGSITTLSASKKSDMGATLIRGIFSSQGSQSQSCYTGKITLGLDIKISDKQTGQIRYVKRIDESQSSSICGDEIPQADSTVLMRSAADKVASGLITSVFPIKVADVGSDGVITLNYGEGSLRSGDYLTIFEPGKALVDPDTGAPMGTSERRIGIVEVIDVQSRFSRAKAVAGFTMDPPQVRFVARTMTKDDQEAFKPGKKKKN